MVRTRHVGVLMVASALAASMIVPASAAEDAEAGNNLSFPVIWAEADGRPTIPGVMGEDGFLGEILEGTLDPDSTEKCFGALQKDAKNTWQAESMDAAPGHTVNVIDWGDNLEVKDWKIGSPVRVETGLYDNTLDAPMNRYEMCYISGKGQTEKWGAKVSTNNPSATASVIASTEAMVFTAGARLTIQRIADPSKATWDAASHQWIGAGAIAPIFNSAVHEKTTDGPGSYGAELNVQGKIIYGYNWSTDGLFNGEYRLTYSLDGATGSFPGSGTSLMGATILASEEGEEEAALISPREGSSPNSANQAVVLGDQELTYIDVALSGGQDPPPIDDGDGGGTTPPPSGGGTTTPPPATSSPGTGEPGGAQAGAGPGDGAGPVAITTPAQLLAQKRQTARIRAPKSAAFKVGTMLVLAKNPVKTSAGVTVRWRATEASEDNCTVRVRNGRATAEMIKAGTCRVIAFAPAPSPEFLRFRETRTYRVTG
jgi:hypothetical protein